MIFMNIIISGKYGPCEQTRNASTNAHCVTRILYIITIYESRAGEDYEQFHHVKGSEEQRSTRMNENSSSLVDLIIQEFNYNYKMIFDKNALTNTSKTGSILTTSIRHLVQDAPLPVLSENYEEQECSPRFCEIFTGKKSVMMITTSDRKNYLRHSFLAQMLASEMTNCTREYIKLGQENKINVKKLLTLWHR